MKGWVTKPCIYIRKINLSYTLSFWFWEITAYGVDHCNVEKVAHLGITKTKPNLTQIKKLVGIAKQKSIINPVIRDLEVSISNIVTVL